jgi:hypothetical protein
MDDATKAAVESWRREMADGDPDWLVRERRILAHIDGEPARTQAAREEAIMAWRAGAADRDELRADCERRIAAAREEQREACALDAEERVGCASTYDELRSVPLDATPLGDELRDEREVSQSLREQLIAAEAERDALRARVAELEEYKEKGDDVQIAAQRLKFWAENPHACPDHFGARTACGQCFDSERALRLASEADLREAHERLDEFGMKRDGTTATVVEGIAAMHTRIDEYRADWYRAEAQVAAARAECASLIGRPWSRWAGDAGRDVLRAMDEAAKK